MRKSLLFSVALGLTISTHAFAGVVHNSSNLTAATSYLSSRTQQSTVHGTVSGADGPLAGITVSVVGTSVSSMTDANGKYTLNAPIGAVLRFTSIGYKAKDVTVSSNTVNVKMDVDDASLETVVVVGYGQQKKAHLTGAVSSVDVEKTLGGRPISDAGRGLQGAVPGLSVVVPSGEVGSDPVMRIRGQVGSQNGNANPLLLVDNVEIPSIQMINPNDIESVTILKDAASASIYGAKAAFGVILITTKKGSKTDKNTVTYTNNLSWQSPFKKIELAGLEGLEYSVDAHENMKAAGAAGGFWRVDRNSLEKIREWQDKYGGTIGNDDPVVYGRDWFWDGTQKFGYRIYDPVAAMIKDNAFSHLHNLGLNGKAGATTYSFNLGYLGQSGMMKPAKHDDFKRFNPTLNVSTKVSDLVTLRGGVIYSEGTKRYPNSTNAAGFGADPWLYLFRWSRLFPVGVQENGQDIIDPAFSARTSNDAIDTKKFLNFNLGTTLQFTKDWNLQADYSYSTQNNGLFSSVPKTSAKTHWYGVDAMRDADGFPVYVDENGVPTPDGGMPAYQFPMTDAVLFSQSNVYQSSFQSRKHTFNAFTTYNLSLNQAHQFKFMMGTNVVANKSNSHWSRRMELIDSENPQFDFAIGTQTVGGDAAWDSQVGFFGRANYAFNDKYLFEANLRYDATSILPDYMRWKWYPSFSGGWVVSKESFMEPLTSVMNFAKLRASWGSIGDQSISNGLYMPEMELKVSNWVGGSGTPVVQLGTPRAVSAGLTWQDIEHLNVGADFKFFNNKLGLTAEWFQRTTKNMIVGGDMLPNSFGSANSALGIISGPNGNYGALRTRGWELAVDFNHRFANGLGLNILANVSDAVSIITEAADKNTAWNDRLLSTAFSTGRRYGDVYGFVTDRLYQAEDFVYDGNGKIMQTTIIRDGSAKVTNMLAGDNPVYQTYFEDGNQVLLVSPGDVKFKDLNGDGYIDAGKGTNGNPGDRTVIGNTTPRYEFGFRLGADYKGFDLSVFLQGVGKRSMWGAGQLAIPGYFSKEGAMPAAIANNYWRPDRTDAFYPRAWNLNGDNEGFVMRTQSRYMLNMAYLRIKNISFGYSLPNDVLSRVKISKARVFVSLENMFTFDKLRGLPIDPEAISGNSSLRANNTYNQGRTGTSNPAFKTASLGVQIGF